MGLAPLPPGYILSSSDTTLESLELSRLNAVSNLRKELHQVVEEWIEAEVQARVARLIRHAASIAQLALDVLSPAVANFPPAPSHSVESLPPTGRSHGEAIEPENGESPEKMLRRSQLAERECTRDNESRCTRTVPNPSPEDQISLKRNPKTALRSLEDSLRSRARRVASPNATRVPARIPRKPSREGPKQKRPPPSELRPRVTLHREKLADLHLDGRDAVHPPDTPTARRKNPGPGRQRHSPIAFHQRRALSCHRNSTG
jgi:hypothetical protein